MITTSFRTVKTDSKVLLAFANVVVKTHEGLELHINGVRILNGKNGIWAKEPQNESKGQYYKIFDVLFEGRPLMPTILKDVVAQYEAWKKEPEMVEVLPF